MDTSKKQTGTPDGVLTNSQLDAARQKVSDDSLLSALSLVIRANVEYAKGVTDLISCDLEREDKLDEIKDAIKDLASRTEHLISSQEVLLRAITTKDSVSEKILTDKLAPIYRGVGLKDDGTDFTPADKWVVKLQEATKSNIFMIVAGAIMFWLAKLVLSGIADKIGH